MGKLIVNGNSVYEVDENCMKKRKRKKKEDHIEERGCGRKTDQKKEYSEKDKTKRG